VLLDAHNAYPYNGLFADRLDRALSTGLPIAIEQDLFWYRDPQTGLGRSVVSHGDHVTGEEPSLDDYFFARVKPLIEQAVREGRRETWPVVTLNLDFKTNEPEHHAAVWALLGRYESWLTTTVRPTLASDITEIEAGPLLVLTGESDEQERSFHDSVPAGSRLRLFGAVHTQPGARPGPRTSYRRWWNHPWSVVEPEGQPKAGEWTAEDDARLQSLVAAAHGAGLWIRFYTLNGHDPADPSGGWSAGYNFGTLDAVRRRWKAAVRAGVDFVAVDQYEQFGEVLRAMPIVLDGTLTRADYERLLEREFDVPPGATRIDVELTYDDRNRTVIDLGLRGPAGFRGWSGGGQQAIFVAPHTASFGYSPGPIEPGRWAVVLGVPNIRERVNAAYTLRIAFSADGDRWPALARGARWYAGDLHSHSGHSDGRLAGPDGTRLKAPVHRVFDGAVRAVLDFIALTDHNTPSHWADVDRMQPLYPGLLLLHGREVTTYRGHVNAFGEHRFVDFRLGPSRPVKKVLADLRAAGAFVSINHPTSPDDERCMGCGWNDRDPETMNAVDGVEIVNGDNAEGPLAGWPFWAEMLNRGHRLVAIGGSDDHTPDDDADRRLGRPTTVILAEELSERALLAGLRAGRVYVRARGVEGPAIELTAMSGAVRAAMGDEVAPTPALTLDVHAQRAEGQELAWVRRGDVVKTVTLGADGRASITVEARDGDWFSVVLRDSKGPTLFSNALYVRSFPPSTRTAR
jgi:hypothetical protein